MGQRIARPALVNIGGLVGAWVHARNADQVPRAPHRRRVPAGKAELLIAREWAILADENDYTTDTFQPITGRPSRSVAEFLHEHRAAFV